MKPLGVAMRLNHGSLAIGVTHPSKTEDLVWEAVSAAISEGWGPRQFLAEVEQAWQQERRDQMKAEIAEIRKGSGL